MTLKGLFSNYKAWPHELPPAMMGLHECLLESRKENIFDPPPYYKNTSFKTVLHIDKLVVRLTLYTKVRKR